MANLDDLGPAGLSADDVVYVARDCLTTRGFTVQSAIDGDKVVLQAARTGWVDTVTGRRLGLVLRLVRQGGRWHGEALLTDWRDNLAFFLAGALLGPVGWSAAALSAVSRCFGDDEARQLLSHLREALADREVA